MSFHIPSPCMSPVQPIAHVSRDRAEPDGVLHLLKLNVNCDERFPDRIFAHVASDPTKTFLIEFPGFGMVGVQITYPLFERLFTAFSEAFDLIDRPDNVMEGVKYLALGVRMWARETGHNLAPGTTCDFTVRDASGGSIFYKAQMLPKDDRFPPLLLLDLREPDAEDRS